MGENTDNRSNCESALDSINVLFTVFQSFIYLSSLKILYSDIAVNISKSIFLLSYQRESSRSPSQSVLFKLVGYIIVPFQGYAIMTTDVDFYISF